MKTIINLIVFLFVCAGIGAQENGSAVKVTEMHVQKWQYIIENAQLNEKEINAVRPIFMEYEKSLWTQHDKKRDFFKSVQMMEKNSKPNYSHLNDQYLELEINQAQLFKIYHLKLRKVLSPETLFNYYKSERAFKRKLLKEMPGFRHRGLQQ